MSFLLASLRGGTTKQSREMRTYIIIALAVFSALNSSAKSTDKVPCEYCSCELYDASKAWLKDTFATKGLRSKISRRLTGCRLDGFTKDYLLSKFGNPIRDEESKEYLIVSYRIMDWGEGVAQDEIRFWFRKLDNKIVRIGHVCIP